MHSFSDLMHHWFRAHLDIIFLCYGLAFWTLGVVIGIWPRRGSKFKFANILWLLGGFGLVHGINEFLDMIEVMSGLGPALQVIHVLALIISYFFLFEFGRQFFLICKEDGPKKASVLFGRRLTFGIGFVIIALSLILGDFLQTASIMARYFLCFPGGLLASISFILYYRREEEILAPREIKKYFFWASISFLAYGILGGLIAPKTSLFPSNLLNTENFFLVAHIPVQVPRAICAIGIIFTVIAILRIFNWETEDLLEKAYDNLEVLVQDRTKELINANQLLKAEVTERKRMEEEARKIGERFQDIAVSAEEWIWETDAEGRYIYSSPVSEKILGYKPEEVIGKYFYDFFYPADREELMRLTNEVVSRRGSFNNFQNRNVTKDGRVITIETSGVPVLDEKGVLAGYRGVDRDITERIKSQDVLRENEEKFRALTEHSPDTIMRLDRQHRHLYVSPKVEKETGIPPQAFIGKTHRELGFPGELCALWEKALDKVLETGQTNRVVFQLPSGIWIDWFLVPEMDKSGKVNAVMTSARDITAYKKIEEGLRKAEERYRTLVENVNLGITLIDKDYNVIMTNAAQGKIFNKDPQLFACHKCYSEFEKRDSICLGCPGTETLKTGKPAEAYRQGKRDDGTILDASIFTFTTFNTDGSISGCSEVVEDITEDKNKDEEIKWKTAFLESQVEASIDGILVVDNKGQRILINKRLLELWNVPEHIINDRNDESLLQYVVNRTKTPGQFLDKVKYLYSHQNETSRDEIEFKDGTIFDRYSSPVKDKAERYFGRIWVFRDITDRKKKEEELKTAYEQLKATQAQLVQSAKMASIGLLAGGVAHEINNPLTGVLNNVQLIKMMASQKRSFKMEDFKELLDVVEESAQRCTKITRSLLGFSRASKGIAQEIPLNDMIEKVTGLLEDELITQNITIRKELDSRLPLVKGDSQLLQQVIFDIVTNARWAIKQKPEHKGGVITIRTAYKAEDKCASIYISDTGIGISRENISKIFEPFFTTKPIGEGTGLGLSIVYNIIKEHNGNITVESESGRGATFKICLPVILP